MRQRLSLRKSSLNANCFKKLATILLSIVFIFILIYCFNSYFSISKIEVSGLNKNETIRGLDILKNQNIFFVSVKENEEKLLNENAYLKKVTIKKIMPNKINITVETHTPVAVLVVNNGYLYLAQNGRILFKQKQNDTNLTVINYYQKLDYKSTSIGNWISNNDIIISLNLLKICLELGLDINSIDINSLDMLGFNLDDKKILFTTKKSENAQRYILENIVQKFNIEGKDFNSLDLRFDKPVIVLKTL